MAHSSYTVPAWRMGSAENEHRPTPGGVIVNVYIGRPRHRSKWKLGGKMAVGVYRSRVPRSHVSGTACIWAARMHLGSTSASAA